MNYRIVHTTRYRYEAPVAISHNEAHLLPRSFAGQTLTGGRLDIQPPCSDYRDRQDYFGNTASYFAILQPHQDVTITATCDVRLTAQRRQLWLGGDMDWQQARQRLAAPNDAELLDAMQFCLDSPLVRAEAALHEYAAGSFAPGRPLTDAVADLMTRIHADFAYDPAATDVTTPPLEVLRRRRGVCQDFAHLAIGCLRSLGLAARYVSGYLETVPPPGQAKLAGADASHAWLQVYLPDVGWQDWDPTNNLQPSDRHVVTAWGRDYSDVPPLKGIIYGGGDNHTIDVQVDVTPLPDTPNAS
ncbi:MAG TPA: transglutaminase [Gammaproteobacteria bacterium]|uniref:transglutaminase family protein n=1 Tax=Immundisolibacter sp. TaxID=1934948 RepID=UPI000E986A10|nr:transglutaminase [Gammaproteobacteria bacterium]HCZ47450.1 transglutaminase [Gammaproteobacteria bacterium]MCH76888.1 transglutaminase [Gammaproteobacteria bacterium]